MLRYNISSNRKPDNKRLAVILGSALILLAIFTTVGIIIQSRDRAEVIDNNDKLDALSQRIDSTTERVGDYRKVISENRNRFGKEIDYINRLIIRSNTPFTGMFNQVEELLPPTVAVRKIQIRKNRSLMVTLESETMQPLIDVLEKVPDQKLVVSEPNKKKNEYYYTATITVGGRK